MAGSLKLAHVEVRTSDIEASVNYYTDAWGMVKVADTGETKYLGFGMDEHFDIAVTDGTTGFDHFAIQATTAEIEACESRLDDRNLAYKRIDGVEPGHPAGLRFTLPSGIPIELVTTPTSSYHRSASPALEGRQDDGPRDLHHIGLSTPKLREDAQFLVSMADLTVTEVRGTETQWDAAWLRRGDMHHDVSLIGTDPSEPGGLHHVAVDLRSADHMVHFLDKLSRYGVDLELGIGRHAIGDNLFAYFKTPDGYRYELSAEMASVDSGTTEFSELPTSTWGANVPDHFYGDYSELVQ